MEAVSSFRGLNNVSDPMRLGMSWLVTADNVNISDTGSLSKRDGYALNRSGAFKSAYSTLDFSRLYLATASDIQTFGGVSIVSLTSGSPLYWAEVNEQVFYNNGTDSGVILPDNNVIPWRDAPITVNKYLGADGVELESLFDGLPLGVDVIQHWRGRMYAAQYMASENQTVLWFSEPLSYYLFNLDSNFIILPGRVEMLAPHDAALVIGTDAKVFAYDGAKIEQVAEYGVVPGVSWARDDERILMWTKRGLCAFPTFTNLTERQVSVAPGVRAGVAVVRSGGQKKFVASLQRGDQPFNAI